MNLDIEPAVAHKLFKDGDEGYLVTAAGPVISLLTYVMKEVESFGIFDYNINSNTQAAYWCNPGFGLEDLKSLLVPAVYVAATYKNINDFWKYGLKQHEQEYQKRVRFTGAIDRDGVRLVLNSWILAKAKTAINNQYRDSISGHGLNRDFTGNRISIAKQTLAALEYLDLKKVYISRWEVGRRIKEIKGLIEKLEADHLLFCRLANESDDNKNLADDVKESYFEAAKKAAQASPELYLCFQDAISDFIRIGRDMDKIADKFDKKAGASIMARIAEISPS